MTHVSTVARRMFRRGLNLLRHGRDTVEANIGKHRDRRTAEEERWLEGGRIIERKKELTANGTGHQGDVPDSIGQDDHNDDAHRDSKYRVDPAGDLDTDHIERREQDHNRCGPSGIRNIRQDIGGCGAAPHRADDGIEQIVHQHRPADQVARDRTYLAAYVGISRACTRIHSRHPPIADGGEDHRRHSEQDRRDDMTTCNIADNAVDPHRRGRLNDDDAIDDQVP